MAQPRTLVATLRRVIALGVVAMSLVLAASPVQAKLSAAEERGKQLYLSGTSARHTEVTALIGAEGVALPASAVPCASCHGRDGLGRPEGGVIPSDIRWANLVKSYGHVHDDGRRHPAFDEASLKRVLATGLDPADNRIDHSMPLYQMGDDDMADLIAYMKRLAADRDPGVEADRIQVATLLPLSGPHAPLGRAMAQVMHAHFQEVNRAGGVFGRRLELLTIPYGNSPAATLDNLRLALQREGVFALVGAYTVGLDQELVTLLNEEYLPLVGPFTLDPGDETRDETAFYLYPGFAEQVRALARTALDRGEAKPSMAVGPEGEDIDRLVQAVHGGSGRKGSDDVAVVRYPAGAMDAGAIAERLAASGSDTLFFLGRQAELDALLAELAGRRLSPRLYLLSAFVSHPPFDAPPSFHQRIFIAYPTLERDVTPAGRAAYLDLAQRHALPPDHIQGQIAAFAAAKLLVEGLRRSGRDLSRQRLVEVLESLYKFDTGLTPPLTYGPNVRVGARGAHVVAVDLLARKLQPVGDWIALP